MKVNKQRMQEVEKQAAEKLNMRSDKDSSNRQRTKKVKRANKGAKSKLVILFIIFIILLLIIFGVVNGGKSKEGKVDESSKVTIVPTTEDISELTVTPIVEPTQAVGVEELATYENAILGLKFKYSADLYVQENTVDLYNTLTKKYSGSEHFNIKEDKVEDLVTIVKFTKGATNNYYITMNILPFNLTTNAVIHDGKTKKTVPITTELNEDMLKTYDESTVETLESKGCTIITMEDSVFVETPLGKGILSRRVYNNSEEVGGTVDILQILIPVGENAILVSGITDAQAINVDRELQLNEIVNSIELIGIGEE